MFSASRDMHFYLEAYEQYAELPAAARRVRDLLSRWHEGRSRRSRSWRAKASIARRKPVPIRFAISLDGVPPGRYDCQVTVVEPTGGKAGFWQAPIAIAP